MVGELTFDRAKRDKLRAAYEAAVAAGQESFEFEGHELLVTFAKYLLEHLDNVLGDGP